MLDEAELPMRRAGVGTLSSNSSIHGDAWMVSGVGRRIGEEGIEFDIVVWRIEAGVIENVESLDVESQLKALFKLEILE